MTRLNTLLSGAYVELLPGSKSAQAERYTLLDSPPLAPSDAKGIHIILDSPKAGQLNPGDPVLFRGYRVGSVETSSFDPQKRAMRYQLFVSAPYDRLVTRNVRFWKDSGIAVDLTASGMRVEMGSLTTLFSGGVSFDVPEGLESGRPVSETSLFKLYDNQRSIQESLYTDHVDYLLFFNDSIRGLQPGAPVEFRGIRLGTVGQVPFTGAGLHQALNGDYPVPVLVRLEPERLTMQLGEDPDIQTHKQTLDNLNKITASQSAQQLPADMQPTLRELNRSMQGFQPDSAAYNKMVADMQRLDQVLRELQPILRTLNNKSNALVFEAKEKKDLQPKRAKE